MLVTDHFRVSVHARPDHAAIVDGDTTLTWADLDAAVRQARTWLTLEGVEAGDRVVFCAPPDATMVVLLWATLEHGAVFVPLHEDLTADQTAYVARNCDARLVITTPVIAAQLHLPVHQQVVPDPDSWRRVRADPYDLPPAAKLDGDDLALLIYTSGTTGQPKGVVCPHRQVAAAAEAIGTCLGYRADDVVLCRLPLSFDYGLYQLLLAVRVGATVVLRGRAADRALLRDMVEHGVTVVPLVPSLARMLTVLQQHRPTATRVRLFTNTGARLSPPVVADLLDAFPAAAYASMYGMTECKRISILPPGEYASHPDSVGYAIPGDEVLIMAEDGTELAAGVTGEIVVRGATVMAGYWGVAPGQQDRYRYTAAGPQLHTGDQGFVDTDGRLYFVGRNDDIIKRHGIRISLHEIEDVAEQHLGVTAAIALKPVTEDGPLVLVHTGTASDLAGHLAAHLDRARRPSSVLAIDAIPLTGNGKPDRAALQSWVNSTHRVGAVVPAH